MARGAAGAALGRPSQWNLVRAGVPRSTAMVMTGHKTEGRPGTVIALDKVLGEVEPGDSRGRVVTYRNRVGREWRNWQTR